MRNLNIIIIFFSFNASLVECLGIFGGILQVLLIGAGKVVGAREVLLGTHVEIVVADVVEHGVDTLHRCSAFLSAAFLKVSLANLTYPA